MTTSAERATPIETPSFPFASQLVAHHTILTRITQLGMIISLICLSMCIFTFWFLSEIQSTRTTIHKNLCCSLFMAEFIFLVGINMNTHKVGMEMHFSPKCCNLDAPLINEAEQTPGQKSQCFYRCSASKTFLFIFLGSSSVPLLPACCTTSSLQPLPGCASRASICI